MKIIKSARAYKVELPGADAMEGHLAEMAFSDISQHEYSRSGFVPAIGNEGLVTKLATGYAFAFRYDEKIVPAASVKAEVAKRINVLEEERGYKVGRKEARELRDRVFEEFVGRALHKTTVVPLFYNKEAGVLVVATASQKIADLATSYLVKAVGSIKAQTIYISDLKHGISTRLRDQIFSGTNSFGDFTLAGSYWLSLDNEKVVIQTQEDEEDSGPLREALERSLGVDAISLQFGLVTFKLGADFVFRAISFTADENEAQEFSSDMEQWVHEAGVQLLTFVSVVESLCKLVGYVPPVEE